MKQTLGIVFVLSSPLMFGILYGAVHSGTEIHDNMQHFNTYLKNYEYEVEYVDYETVKSMHKSLSDLRKMKAPPHIINQLVDDLKECEDGRKTFQEQKVIQDCTGKCKVELKTGYYNSEGKKQIKDKFIESWDGDISIQFSDCENDLPPGALISNRTPEMIAGCRKPCFSFGGEFRANLKKALDSSIDVQVAENAEGQLILTFTNNNVTYTGTMDPIQGYSVVSSEKRFPNGGYAKFTADFKELKENVWMPISGKIVRGMGDEIDATTDVEIKKIIVNNEDFSDNLFHIDFPKGTTVVDTNAGVQYIVGKPMSISDLKGGTNQDVSQLALDSLESLGDNSEFQIFIPKMKIAQKSNKPFAFDVKSEKLVFLKSDALSSSEEEYLFWDEEFFSNKPGFVKSIKVPGQKLLITVPSEKRFAYRLPEGFKLPYIFILQTDNSVLLTSLVKIDKEGAWIKCRVLSQKEQKSYLVNQ